MNCPNCNRANAVNATNCAYCGTPFNSAGAVASNPFSDRAAQNPQSEFVPYAQPVHRNLEDEPALRYLIPIGRSIHAIIAGYLGLLSLAMCFLGPFAILFGVLAIIDIKKNPKKVGMVRAIVGIVLGVIGTLLLVGAIVASVVR